MGELSAILALLSSHVGEKISAKGISLHLEVGRGCNPIKNKIKTLHLHR